MGNSVTTTPIEKLKIDETNDDFEDNDISVGFNTNAINGTNYDNYNIEPQNHFPKQQNSQDHYNQDWNNYHQQYMGQLSHHYCALRYKVLNILELNFQIINNILF